MKKSSKRTAKKKASSSAGTIFQAAKPVVGIRAVHLDLKGVPPTPARLLEFLDLCSVARYNAVVVEWEDMFPWTIDERFRCETAYTPAEVAAFLAKAKKLSIEIIPLVQCLGHMETVLRWKEYAHLREVPANNDVINPLAKGARELIERMVNDVLSLMPDVKYFHLGGDEAWTFGSHPETKAYIEKHGKGALYMHHVEPILDMLNAKNIRPILWHDMMTHWEDAALKAIKDKADLCVWGYGEDPRKTKHHFAVEHIKRFKKHGIAMWAGSAYKGADGVDSDVPNTERRTANMTAWTEVAREYGMKGIIMTAWSRYSTNQMQDEPIDGALETFMLGGIIPHDGRMPKDVARTVAALVQKAGETERYKACRDIVVRLASQRKAAWDNVRMLRGFLQCAKDDTRRADSYHAGMHRTHLSDHIKHLEWIAPEFKKAFSGLIPDLWIDRYMSERIQPLRDELAAISAAMQ